MQMFSLHRPIFFSATPIVADTTGMTWLVRQSRGDKTDNANQDFAIIADIDGVFAAGESCVLSFQTSWSNAEGSFQEVTTIDLNDVTPSVHQTIEGATFLFGPYVRVVATFTGGGELTTTAVLLASNGAFTLTPAA